MRLASILFTIFFFTLFQSQSFAQENVRYGFHLSPGVSWMQTNDPAIDGQGANLALSLGILADYWWQDNVSLIGGLNLKLNQGGSLIYSEGGNFFPKSDLNNPKLNQGEKPLPNGVEIKYSFSALEVPFGLKLRTEPMGNFSYFAEIPVFSLGLVTSAKADINGSGVQAEDENIGRDFRNMYLTWRLGIGAEYETAGQSIVTAGLHFQRGISDMTRDKGITVDSSTGDTSREKSRASFGNLWLRLGILF